MDIVSNGCTWTRHSRRSKFRHCRNANLVWCWRHCELLEKCKLLHEINESYINIINRRAQICNSYNLNFRRVSFLVFFFAQSQSRTFSVFTQNLLHIFLFDENRLSDWVSLKSPFVFRFRFTSSQTDSAMRILSRPERVIRKRHW